MKVALISNKLGKLIVRSLPPQSNSLDLNNVEIVELQSADRRIIGRFVRKTK